MLKSDVKMTILGNGKQLGILNSKVFKVTACWGVLTISALSLFVLARNDVNSRRREIMMSKKRMSAANQGDYESNSYKGIPAKLEPAE